MNFIEVNTLGKIISVKPGEPKCKPVDLTSSRSFFVIILYGMATWIKTNNEYSLPCKYNNIMWFAINNYYHSRYTVILPFIPFL